MNCLICQSPANEFATTKVRAKYDALFRKCTQCGFVFIENPNWLAEAYQTPINRADIGPVWRTEFHSKAVKAIIELFFRSSTRYLDFGAGYGLFVRRMRDLGYDFLGHDRYCESIFAADFQIEQLGDSQFDIITAFEVAEHLESPMDAFAEIFAHSPTVIFSTELFPDSSPLPGEWWYYGLDHGQHISLFSREALKVVAAKFGRHLTTDGRGFHMIGPRKLKNFIFRKVTSERTRRIIDLLFSRPSLLPADFDTLRKRSHAEVGSKFT